MHNDINIIYIAWAALNIFGEGGFKGYVEWIEG